MTAAATPPDRFLDPDVLARVSDYALLARTVVEGFLAGLHRSVQHGFGSEFVQYREYVPGDDLKALDWRVFARRDDKVMKVYQEETNTNCYVVLDASASMGYAGRAMTKLHYGKLVAACLTYLVLRQGDSAAFYAYSDRLRAVVPPGARGGHLRRVCAELARLEAVGQADHARVLNYLGERCRRRGIVVVVSDFLDAGDVLFKAVKRFRFQHHDVILMHVLDDDELDFDFRGPTRFVDSETGEQIVTAPTVVREHYRRAMNSFVDGVRRFARQVDVDYRQVRTSQPLDVVLAEFLHTR